MEKEEMQPSVLLELESMAEFGILNTDCKEYEIQGRSSGFDIHLPPFSTIKLLFPQLISVRISKNTFLYCYYYVV